MTRRSTLRRYAELLAAMMPMLGVPPETGEADPKRVAQLKQLAYPAKMDVPGCPNLSPFLP